MTKPEGSGRRGGRQDKQSRNAESVSITDAGAAHSDEIRARMIKYATAMGIRMVCLGLLFVLDGWFKLLAIAGAVFLPWIAAVIANGGDMAETPSDKLIGVPLQKELPAEAGEDSDTAAPRNDDGGAAESAGDGTVIQGEILRSTDRPDERAHRDGDAA